MRIGIRVQYILALLLLPVLAAAALLFSGSISARAYATTDLYTLTFANEAGDVSVRLNFMAETDQPGYCMYYADVTDFSALLPDGCTLDSFTNDDMVWNPSGSAVIARYNISYFRQRMIGLYSKRITARRIARITSTRQRAAVTRRIMRRTVSFWSIPCFKNLNSSCGITRRIYPVW